MKETSRLEEFRQATAVARQRAAMERATLDAASSRPAEPGDVYLFPGDGDIATRWVVVALHSDRPDLLFAVPADGHPLFGLADLPLTDEGGRRLTLRCGLGVWLSRDVFRSDNRLRILPSNDVRRAREKTRQVVTGALNGPEASREGEANPDYREWLGLVASAVDRLAGALRTPALVLTPAEFQPTLPFGRPPVAEVVSLDMAAASPDMAEEAAASLELPATSRLACRIDLLYPGEVLLLLESSGVAIWYQTESETAPPQVFGADASGVWQPLTWSITPGGSAARAFAPWAGEAVHLRFGEGDFSKEVTVSRQ